MVWFPDSWFYLSRKKCTVAMFSYFKKSEKKNLLREVYLLARCLMLNWSRRHAFLYATKTWNLWIFFYSFSNVFAEKYIKNILQEMKDGYHGLSLRQQQLPLIMYYITVADPDLHIRGGGGKGVSKKLFRPFRPQFGLKIRGRGPLP